MKRNIKTWVATVCLFGSLFGINPASAATTSEIETVFNWAENNFPELFPEHRTTQMIDPWAFRFYPSTGIYTGIKNDEVYVLGGPWGTASPTFIATLPNLLGQIQGEGGNGSVPACSETSDLPQGMVVTQSGNVVNITTNGQCIVIDNPESADFCEAPIPLNPTGISVLSTVEVTSFQTTGITIDSPGFPNPLDSFMQNSSSCIIEAPAEMVNLVVNSNVCYDLTNQLSLLPSGFGITIDPPVTVTTVSSSISQQVSDCFASDAAVINNLVTGETWVNTNGSFVPVPNTSSSF
ncbi:MAG: hypothetical protein H6940_08905 [Burkholderiales bacterium]|nr:hypothetical protein [Burkholderiales bacterium]